MLRLTINPQSPDEARLRQAAEIIQQGGIALYPTETVYGLGVRYDNEQALERLFAVKGRKETQPVLLLIENRDQLEGLAAEISVEALDLACLWWPGPLTLLFRARPGLSPHITGRQGKIACRISSCPTAQKLVALTGCPIISTSANMTGLPSASRLDELPQELLRKVDVLVDAGPTPGGLASTLLDVSSRPFHIVREGVIASHLLLGHTL